MIEFRKTALALLPVALAPFPTEAQQAAPVGKPQVLQEVVVTATRVEEDSFDLPVSIDRVDRGVIREDKPQVNLSEALNRVPGISVLNRQNYAQDLQISSRGFGARATFGVRGLRLIADGILVVGGSEITLDEADRGHVLDAVVAVGRIVQRALLVDDADRRLMRGDLHFFYSIEPVPYLRVEPDRGFHRGLGMKFRGKRNLE